jgi:hypothetical protein
MTRSGKPETPYSEQSSPSAHLQAQTDAMFKVQGETLEQIDKIQRSWFECLRSGVDSAGSFTTRLSQCSNPNEAAELYREWLDRRLESITEDGKRFAEQWRAMCSASLGPFRASGAGKSEGAGEAEISRQQAAAN